jgi:hypothetical protein
VNPYGDTVTALRALAGKTDELLAHLKATDRLPPCFNLPALTEAHAQLARLNGLGAIVTTSVAIGTEADAISRLGKDMVTNLLMLLEERLSPQQMGELLIGTVSAGAGYLAVLCGPDRANAMLKALPSVTSSACAAHEEQQTRH